MAPLQKFKEKTIDGIKYVQSKSDLQWYPKFLDDWKVQNQMDKAHKLKIQSTDPSDFRTYKAKDHRRTRYNGIPNLRRANVAIQFKASRQEIIDEYVRCRDDIVYFAENYCSIVHIDLGNIKMVPRPYQREMLEVADENRFSIFLLPRQLGKCLGYSTDINIRNRKTNEIVNMSIGEFHDMIKTCKFCNEDFETKSKKATCCGSERCVDERSRLYKKADAIRKIEKSRKACTEENKDDWVECKECGLRAGDLCSHISRVHKMSISEYQNKHGGGSELVNSANNLVRKADVIGRGADNHAYQHGGVFSPWSSKSKFHSLSGVRERHKKAIERSCAVPRSNNLQWWVDKGYSLEEAEIALKDRQTTFSLDKCIDKHGVDEGTRIWEERQEKWQDTLSSKSPEEIMEINRKKASGSNLVAMWRQDESLTSRGTFYAIRVSEDKVKLGITTRDIHTRWGEVRKNSLEHFTIEHETILESFRVERVLKRHFSSKSITKNEQVGNFGWTETFRIGLSDVWNAIDDLDIDMLFEEIRNG